MRRETSAVRIAALWIVLAGSLAQAGPQTLEECEALIPIAGDDSFYDCAGWFHDHVEDPQAMLDRVEPYLDDEVARSRARYGLAMLLFNRDRKRSIQLLREAAEGFAVADDVEGQARSRAQLAHQLRRYLELDEAREQLDIAAGLAEQLEDVGVDWVILTGRAADAHFRNDYSRAWLLYRQLELDPRFQDLNRGDRVNTLGRLAEIAQSLRRNDEAMSYLTRKREACSERGFGGCEADAVAQMGLVTAFFADEGRAGREAAVEYGRQALRLALEHRDVVSEMTARVVLGGQAEMSEAVEHLDKLIEQAPRYFCWDIAMEAQRTRAIRLYEEGGADSDETFAVLREVLRQAAERGDHRVYVETLTRLAQMRMDVGPRERAIAETMTALDGIESYRELQSASELRADMFSDWTDHYYRLIDYVLSQDTRHAAIGQAFAASERLRARVLLDHTRTADDRAAPGDDQTRDEFARFQREISEIQLKLLDPDLTGDARERQLAQLERLEVSEADLRTALTGERVQTAVSFVDREQLESSLQPDEAMISYLLSPSRIAGSWMLVHTRGETRAHPLPTRESVEARVTFWNGLVAQRDGSESLGVGRLYADLLKPALEEIGPGVRKLVIVPDGALHRLPVGALRESAGALPLSMRFEISLAPSATLWLELREKAALAGKSGRSLILADPERGETDARRADLRGGWLHRLEQGPLPHARREAERIRLSLGGAGSMRVGPEASEALVKGSELATFGLVHFAAHAVVDEINPARSAILLAPGEEEDGMLQVRELADLDFRGKVVTLSACQTAGGATLSGEGVMSLARAFFRSGAHTVVASLWPLRDDETAELMSLFYEELAAGRSVSAAMAHARRTMIDAGEPPAAWAGMIVLGAADAAPLMAREAPVWRRPLPLAIAGLSAILFLALVLIAGLRRRARRSL